MCGIIGYVGPKSASLVLREGLKKLEYRGYDSAGIATVNINGKTELHLKKGLGSIDSITDASGSDLPGFIGLGHTRWATHGKVTNENAHPHTDESKEIAVVHNGIIENFSKIKTDLEGRHDFKSDCDSEVIPHLIEDFMKNGKNFAEAVRLASKKLKGSYALLAVSVKEPDLIVGVRKDSPLIVGVKDDGEYLLASDVLPLSAHSNQAAYLNDGEGVVIGKAGLRFFDVKTGDDVVKAMEDLKVDGFEDNENEFDHFMLKEILEQPVAIEKLLSSDERSFQEAATEIMNAKRVSIIACGTSRHAGLIGRYLLNTVAGKFCEVTLASEFSYFNETVDEDTLLIAVSQSGETADVLDAVKKSKAQGARVISLVNSKNSSLERESHKTLHLECGPEIGVASTKAFVNQLILFYLLAFTCSKSLKKRVPELKALPRLVEKTLKDNFELSKKIALDLKDSKDAYYIARGINFATALEGALKLKEISYIHAEGMPGGELKHGTLALIEEGTPVIVIAPNDYTYNEILSNALEAKSRGARLIGVTDKENAAFEETFKVPQTSEVFYPLLTVLPLQLLAYHAALIKGNNPDKPRNLAKAVSVK